MTIAQNLQTLHYVSTRRNNVYTGYTNKRQQLEIDVDEKAVQSLIRYY